MKNKVVRKLLMVGLSSSVVLTSTVGVTAASMDATTTDVVVEEQEFAESKAASSAAGTTAYTPSRPEPSAAAGDGFMNIPDGVEDEGLPFN